MSPDIFVEKPEYKRLLYGYLIDVNNSRNIQNPDARELMNISLIGPHNLPKSLEYKVLPYGSGNKQINITYGIGKDNNKYVPKNYFGVEFSEYSSLSKNLSNSEILQKQIINQYDYKTKKFNSNKLEVDLTMDSQNLQYSIGHFTIFEPKMMPDGTFVGQGFDLYNYEYKTPDGTTTIDLNNKAYALQML